MATFDAALLPPRLARLPRDRRGFPVTFVTGLDAQGVPDFTVTSQARCRLCAARRLCGLCGGDLGYWVMFVGSPKAADDTPPTYLDPGMHAACVVAALEVCPWLAYRDASRRPARLPVDNTGLALGRPDRHVVLVARGFTTSHDRSGRTWFQPRPVKFRYDCTYGPDGRLEIPRALLDAAAREQEPADG